MRTVKFTTHWVRAFVLLGLLMVLGASCLPVLDWEHDVTHEGIHFEKIAQRTSGTIVGIIDQDSVIQGYPAKKGWVHLDSDFKLINFTSSQPIDNKVSVIPADTYVRLNEKGQITVCALPKTTEIQGHLCIGTGGPKGVHTSFYPDGELRRFFSPKTVEIDNIPCKGGVFHYIELHPNGRLKQCTLAQTTMIDNTQYRAGTTIHLDTEGRVVPANK